MKIKNPALFWIAIAALAVAAYFVIDRCVFLARAERATGVVRALDSENDRCGSKKNRYPCTLFHAEVDFAAALETGHVRVSAGRVRGHNQPLSRADYRPGDAVPVIYNPSRITQAYRDTVWDVWATPVLAFFFHISFLIGGFSEKKRRRQDPGADASDPGASDPTSIQS